MAKRLCVTIFLSALLVGVTGGVALGYSWHVYNGHYYALTTGPASWTEAEAAAVAVGGHLVTINDEAEDIWLSQTFNEDNLYGPKWIGLYQDTKEFEPAGGWKWVSGENSEYRNWFTGFLDPETYVEEPNNYGGTEDYAFKFFDFALAGWNREPTDKWVDATDGGILGSWHGIIETTSPVPIPGSLLLLGTGLLGLAGGWRRISKS